MSSHSELKNVTDAVDGIRVKKFRDKRLMELKQLLIVRGYNLRTVDSALERVKKIPRKIALRKVSKPNQTERPLLAATYNPRLPYITNIQAKH